VVLETVRREGGPRERWPNALRTKLAQGGHHAQVHLEQAKWEAGSCERQPKTLKGELENHSRKPRAIVRKRHSDSLKKVQLTCSQGNKKRGIKLLMVKMMMMRRVPVCHKTE
jgi:hypothetical protein